MMRSLLPVPATSADRAAAALLRLAVLTVSSLIVAALTLTDSPSLLRPMAVFWFVLVGPGLGLVPLLRLNHTLGEWVLAIAISLALDTAVAGLMVATGTWSPTAGLLILIGVSLAGATLHFAVEAGLVAPILALAQAVGALVVAVPSAVVGWRARLTQPRPAHGGHSSKPRSAAAGAAWSWLAALGAAILLAASLLAVGRPGLSAASAGSRPQGATPSAVVTRTAVPTMEEEGAVLVEDATLVAELSATPLPPSETPSLVPTSTPPATATLGAPTSPEPTSTSQPGASPEAPTDSPPGATNAPPSATSVPNTDPPPSATNTLVPGATVTPRPTNTEPPPASATTAVPTATPRSSATARPSATRTATTAPTATRTPTLAPTSTRTATVVPTRTATASPTFTATPTYSPTPVPSSTPTASATLPPPTVTFTPAPTDTPTVTPEPTATNLPLTFTISGRINGGRHDDDELGGVLLQLSDGASVNSDGGGGYAIAGRLPGVYILVPTKADCRFSPDSRAIVLGLSDSTGNDFRAHCDDDD